MVPIKTLRRFLATIASVALALVALGLPNAEATAPQVFTPSNGFVADPCGDPMPSTFSVTPAVDVSDSSNWPVSDGIASYTGTVTARDGGCNGGQLLPDLDPKDFTFTPSSSDAQVSAVVNNGDGTYSARFTSLRAGADFTVTAQYQGMRIGNPSTTDAGLPIPFKPGTPTPVPCSPSTVTASQASQTAGGTIDLSAHLGSVCDPIVGAVVTFTAISANAQVVPVQATTDATGLATATITDKTAETVSVEATYTSSSGSGSLGFTTVTFTAGPSSTGPFDCQPGQESTNASASPVVVPSPGPSTVRAYVTDRYCNPVTGALVGFDVPASSHATYFTTPGWGSGYTDNGIVLATLSDPVAETTQVWVSADGYRMATNPASGLFVTFSNGTLAPTMTFTVSYPRVSTSTTADGKDAATGVVTVRDANNALVTNLNPADFKFSPSSADVKVSAVTNNGDGTYSADFTSLVADSTVTVYASYRGVAIGSPAPTVRPIPFAPGSPVEGPYTCPDGRQGTHLAASSVKLAVGEVTYITAFITDANCNPTYGGLLELNATGSAKFPSGASTYLWNGDGTVAVTDSTAETSVISSWGSAGGGDVVFSGFTGSVNVTWGDSTVVPVASMAYDPATGYLTATVTDGHGAPLPNIAVVFTRPSSPFYTIPTITQTDGNGQAKYWAKPMTPQACSTYPPDVIAATVVAPGGSLIKVAGSPITIPPIPPDSSFATSCSPGELVFSVSPVAKNADSSNWPAADGVSSYTATARVSNWSGDPMKYLGTAEMAFTPSSTKVSVSPVVNNGDGTYSVTLTTKVADPNYTLSMTYGGNVATAADLRTTSLPIPYRAAPAPRVTLALPSISLSGPRQQTVTGSNFRSGERVHLVVESTPWDIGYRTADAKGTVVFTFTVPANFPVGRHTATLTGSQSGAVSGTFEVTAIPSSGSNTPTITVATGGLVASSGLGPTLGAVGAGFVGLAFLWVGIAAHRRKEEGVR